MKKEENFINEKKDYMIQKYYFDKIKSFKLKLDNLEKNKLKNIIIIKKKNQTELKIKRLELK